MQAHELCGLGSNKRLLDASPEALVRRGVSEAGGGPFRGLDSRPPDCAIALRNCITPSNCAIKSLGHEFHRGLLR